jgi:starch synthase
MKISLKLKYKHSDAVIVASENLSPSLTKFIESSGKPFLPFAPKMLSRKRILISI